VRVPGANGLLYGEDTQTLYAVTFGGEQGDRLWTIELDEAGTVTDTAARTIVEKGRFDGIARQPNGKLLISGGARWRVGDGGRWPLGASVSSVSPNGPTRRQDR